MFVLQQISGIFACFFSKELDDIVILIFLTKKTNGNYALLELKVIIILCCFERNLYENKIALKCGQLPKSEG